MFIEKVSDKSLVKFMSQYVVGLGEVRRRDDNIYVLGIIDSMGPQPEFCLKDFDAKMLNNYQHFNEQIKIDWRNFLYSTFGKEYETAIKKHLDEQKQEMLNEFKKIKQEKDNKNEL